MESWWVSKVKTYYSSAFPGRLPTLTQWPLPFTLSCTRASSLYGLFRPRTVEAPAALDTDFTPVEMGSAAFAIA
jgi:hypothetical protein